MIDDGTFLPDRIFLNPMNIGTFTFHMTGFYYVLYVGIELGNTDTTPSTGGVLWCGVLNFKNPLCSLIHSGCENKAS